MKNFRQYSFDELGGIPWEWWYEIDAACDQFFIRRGMSVKGQTLKQIMEQQYKARRKQLDYESNNCYD